MTVVSGADRAVEATGNAVERQSEMTGVVRPPRDGQARADHDDALARADQTGSDCDQVAADRDQAAADSDQAASDRDLARGSDAEAHRRSREARDRTAQQRRYSATGRLQAAEPRDQIARARDLMALTRERGATAQARALAAADREQAARDREQAARDREHATHDRLHAQAEREDLLRQLALGETDGLTGTRGRASGLEYIDHEIERAGQCPRSWWPTSTSSGSKPVNDAHGHAAGDTLLQHAVHAIRGHLRSYDLIIRIGGDEFLCVMSGATIRDAHQRFSVIQASLAENSDGCKIKVGFASLAAEDTAAELIRRADAELPTSSRR